MFGTGYTDLCYGYNAFWRRCLPQLYVTCDGFEVETIINVRAAKAGLEIVEVPSYEQSRIHGESNLNAWRDGRRVLRAIMSERLTRLQEPNDGWMPQFGEIIAGATMSPVRYLTVVPDDGIERAVHAPAPRADGTLAV